MEVSPSLTCRCRNMCPATNKTLWRSLWHGRHYHLEEEGFFYALECRRLCGPTRPDVVCACLS